MAVKSILYLVMILNEKKVFKVQVDAVEKRQPAVGFTSAPGAAMPSPLHRKVFPLFHTNNYKNIKFIPCVSSSSG